MTFKLDTNLALIYQNVYMKHSFYLIYLTNDYRLFRHLNQRIDREKSNQKQLDEYRNKIDELKSESERRNKKMIEDKIKATAQLTDVQ